jgi:hypothetical protein
MSLSGRARSVDAEAAARVITACFRKYMSTLAIIVKERLVATVEARA